MVDDHSIGRVALQKDYAHDPQRRCCADCLKPAPPTLPHKGEGELKLPEDPLPNPPRKGRESLANPLRKGQRDLGRVARSVDLA